MAPPRHTVVVIDPMAGVRDGLRWILASDTDIEVVIETDDVATVLRSQADVVVSGLKSAVDLTRGPRPVVVHTWLPDDERPANATAAAFAVVRHGRLRWDLAPAIRAAAAHARRAQSSSGGSGVEPDLAIDSSVGGPANR